MNGIALMALGATISASFFFVISELFGFRSIGCPTLHYMLLPVFIVGSMGRFLLAR